MQFLLFIKLQIRRYLIIDLHIEIWLCISEILYQEYCKIFDEINTNYSNGSEDVT